MPSVEDYKDIQGIEEQMRILTLDREAESLCYAQRTAPLPIDNVLLALCLLNAGDRYWTYRELKRLNPEKPFIWYGVFKSGYTGEELTTAYEYPIKPEVVEELLSRGFVVGVPRWGYSSKDELIISGLGRNYYHLEREKNLHVQAIAS